MQEPSHPLISQCISIDLEVDPKTARIFGLAAVWPGKKGSVVSKNGRLDKVLDQIEHSVSDQTYLIGHNILRHDLPFLVAERPRLAQLAFSPIDTLWLNPLAFPRNPYHRLVKHYQDGRLQAGHVNDPEQDARLVFDVLANQLDAFSRLNAEEPDIVSAYHYLATRSEASRGVDAVFKYVRGTDSPNQELALATIRHVLRGRACSSGIDRAVAELSNPAHGWPLAYAISWITVAGGDSVMPPWVRKQFRDASRFVKVLRDTSCNSMFCEWCREHNNTARALKRWFGFDAFRPEPSDKDGHPLQQVIVEQTMKGQSLLGILPTGTGKSLCYQIPALSKFDRTGALTVVISPLVALMSDQVQGMARVGISSATTINGMLSMPERQDALDRVRMGDTAILLISPEQLRSVSVRSVLNQREVGLWVLDEAHCVSKWGHDFRPDYRYVGRFIREFTGDDTPAPILCLTATAKPEVVRDIRDHFQSKLGTDLLLVDGGAVRTNLHFKVSTTNRSTKLVDILDAIKAKLPPDETSGAIVYCATRSETERVAEFLQQQGLAADFYHAGLPPDEKRTIQERFRTGELRVIAATNAFGMGIDKPDIRLVVHGDIPGSLENYLQEAGRAGRDRAPAECLLLFSGEDIERQFSLSARSRLARHEIGAILKALRRINEKTRRVGEVVATSGEIVRADREQEFERDTATDDTRVRTAISWLEESLLLVREENRVQVFPSSLRIRTLEEAEAILNKADITGSRRKQLMDIVQHLINAPPDSGVSTDELAGVSGLIGSSLNKALADLETFGIARNDLAVTMFVHVGIDGSSQQRRSSAAKLEVDLINMMRESAPDADGTAAVPLSLSETCQQFRDNGHDSLRPDIIERLLRGMSQDGRDQEGGKGNIRLKKLSRNTLLVTLQRSWKSLMQTANIRHQGAELVLGFLVDKVPKGVKGKDLQVETTMGDLLAALNGDALLRSGVQDTTKLLERILMWLHEQEIITLGKGLTVFRSAMTIHLQPGQASFTQKDFLPLEEHYDEQTLQTHVMAAYAETALNSIPRALKLSEDYFVLDKDAFVRRWLPGRSAEIRRQTTAKSWKIIVEALNNSAQQKVVTDEREQTNVLVLAGPGSGKTRVLVHRIAYLIRVRREDPRDILVLTYNRHAAAEIRARLRHLIGDEAHQVTISTCHALAMRLVGASFVGKKASENDFDEVMRQAVRLLNGDGLSKSEAEAQRETLIQGYRWILVDEYQDVGPEEYSLIAAVAGRSLDDPQLRLSLFAVGDDDQNIYAFTGASIRYIRQFESDYRARPEFLTENYRSSAHIIEAANAVIAISSERMKAGRNITVDRKRLKAPAGGEMESLDPVSRGRVQLLDCSGSENNQAMTAVDELLRLSKLDPDWSWTRAAIISREWRRLNPVRAYAESLGIPVEMANEGLPSIWRLREMQRLVSDLRLDASKLLSISEVIEMLNRQAANRWTELIAEGIAALARELGERTMPVPDLIEWLAEWSRSVRGDQRGLLLLTAHRAKGLEFDDVVILGGNWHTTSKGDDPDAPRRLFYVAMTRARRSLSVVTSGPHPFLTPSDSVLLRHPQTSALEFPSKNAIFQMPNYGAVDLSWAGRLHGQHKALRAIESAQVGDPLTLAVKDGNWLIVNAAGESIGRMASQWSPPDGLTFVKGQVGAIIRWSKSDNDDKYRDRLRRDEWETVLPELAFE